MFNDADAWKRTPEWTLSRPWEVEARPSFLTIALSHPSFHLSVDYVTVSLLVPCFTQDLWEFMPAWLALCDLGAPGWGEPWFPHSAVLLSLTSLVWRFCLWCFAPSCVLFSRHTNQISNAKSLSFATVLYGPMSLCNVFWRFGCCFVCFWFLFPVFCLVCLFGQVFRFILHRDGLLDCVLVLLQHYFCGPSLKKMD